MIQFKEKFMKHKLIIGGATFVGLAASFYYFYLRKHS